MPAGLGVTDGRTWTAARAGDEDSFERLVRPHRRELFVHCYRMLGSVHDAEDAMQDALLRMWRGIGGVSSPDALRPWLYRVATNTSLDLAQRRSRRDASAEIAPWLQPLPDESGDSDSQAGYERREDVELAFIAALQELPGNQRAALILREVLGFTAREVADTMDTTEASVKSALQRARAAMDQRAPDRSQQATLQTLGDHATRGTVQRYIDALDGGDVGAIVALLAEDATWSMPPLSQSFHGRAAISEFLRAGPTMWHWRHLPTRANGQPAVGCYRWDADEDVFAATVIDVLTLRDDGQIAAVTAFIDASLFPRFGLPGHIEA